jgi:hypothetical protein
MVVLQDGSRQYLAGILRHAVSHVLLQECDHVKPKVLKGEGEPKQVVAFQKQLQDI